MGTEKTELGREWLARARQSLKLARESDFDTEQWDRLEEAVYRALKALLTVRGATAGRTRAIEKLWAEAAAGDDAMPDAEPGDLEALGAWSRTLHEPDAALKQTWLERLRETAEQLIAHADERVEELAAAPEAPGAERDREAIVAEWPESDRDWLTGFVETLAARYAADVVDVVVYGSKARGDWHEDSDLDILAILTDETGSEEEKAIDALGDDAGSRSTALPSVWTIRAGEWQARADEGSPWRRAIERDGFSVWEARADHSSGSRPAPVGRGAIRS